MTQARSFRVLALVTDAYGGHGGIAKYNRDVLNAFAAAPGCVEVVCIPRSITREVTGVPPRVRLHARAARGKLSYLLALVHAVSDGPFDLVWIGHINLSALGKWAARLLGAPALLGIYGVDAWTSHHRASVRRSLAAIDRVVGISEVTLDRFNAWAKVDPARLRLLAPCIELAHYAPGPKPPDLVERFGLAGKTVIMTTGRLVDEDRHKGFDVMLECLPSLVEHVPELVYVICGDGANRTRLEAKSAALGIADRVRFTGFVPEARKADYYRLADVFAMPSRGEGFGIVLLEAIACGIPAVGSREDGAREALLHGRLGELVDPLDPADIRAGILRALHRTRTRDVPAALAHYSMPAFERRVSILIRDVLGLGCDDLAEVQRVAGQPMRPA